MLRTTATERVYVNVNVFVLELYELAQLARLFVLSFVNVPLTLARPNVCATPLLNASFTVVVLCVIVGLGNEKMASPEAVVWGREIEASHVA
jgi:hypothetical protein